MKQYRVSSVLYPSANSSLDGLSTDLFFYGCTHKCKGCHNRELWEFVDYNYSLDELLQVIEIADKSNIVTLLGGEPLQQDIKSLLYLIQGIKQLDKKVAIYTGYEFQDVPDEILDVIDYIKTGKYLCNHKTPFGSFLASTNQIMWKKIDKSWERQWYWENNGGR